MYACMSVRVCRAAGGLSEALGYLDNAQRIIGALLKKRHTSTVTSLTDHPTPSGQPALTRHQCWDACDSRHYCVASID